MAGEPYIDPAAQLGEGVRVGRFSVIGPRVRLGAGSVVADHCVVGEAATGAPLEIGPGALIRSFTALEEGSRIGPGFTTGHHVFCCSRMKSAVSAGDVGRTKAPSASNFCRRSG